MCLDMNEKRICFLTDNDINETGGEQRVLSSLLNELAESHTVFLACPKPLNGSCPYSFSSKIHILPLSESPPYRYWFLPARVMRKTNQYTGILEKLKLNKLIQILEYPDSLIDKWVDYLNAQSFDTVIGLSKWFGQLLMVCGSRIHARTITWFHGNYDRYYETPREYSYGQKCFLQSAKDNIDALVVLTKKDEETYRQLYDIPAIRIYNPLSFRSNQKSSLDHKQLLYIGRMNWKLKGLDYLLDILEKIFMREDEWSVDIVGDGDDFNKLVEAIEKKPWKHRVYMHGDIEDVASRYQNADILLLTSRHEGFGLVVTEAMECGLPVVSFMTNGPSEIIENGKNGYLVEKYDTNAFADKVLALMKDDPLRKEMGSNAVIRANDFEIDVIKQEWDAIL